MSVAADKGKERVKTGQDGEDNLGEGPEVEQIIVNGIGASRWRADDREVCGESAGKTAARRSEAAIAAALEAAVTERVDSGRSKAVPSLLSTGL